MLVLFCKTPTEKLLTSSKSLDRSAEEAEKGFNGKLFLFFFFFFQGKVLGCCCCCFFFYTNTRESLVKFKRKCKAQGFT